MNLNEYIKKFLSDRLALDAYLNKEEQNKFFIKIEKYLSNRSSVETFFSNVDETIDFLRKIGLNDQQIIGVISSWPAIIHNDKQELFYKYLHLGRLPEIRKVLGFNRDELLINHPKDFMTGLATIHARICFFLSDASKDVTREEFISRKKLFKTTNKEFEESYHVNMDELISKFPVTKETIIYLMTAECNREVVERFYGKGKEFGKGSS